MKKLLATLVMVLGVAVVGEAKEYQEYATEIRAIKGHTSEDLSKIFQLCKEALKNKAYKNPQEEAFYYSQMCRGYVYGPNFYSGVEYCKKSIALYPENSLPYLNLATIYEKSGEIEPALEYAQKAYTLILADNPEEVNLISASSAYIKKLEMKKQANYVFALAVAYHKNALSADADLKGNTYAFWGFAEDIGREADGRARMIFSDEKNFPQQTVVAYFTQKEEEKLRALSRGDRVYFIGTVKGKKEAVLIGNCSLFR